MTRASFTGYAWGSDRGFVLPSGCIIRVVAHLHGGLIDDLFMFHCSGDGAAAAQKVDALRREFVGRPIADWNTAK